MAPLSGSLAQIAWAEEIRKSRYAQAQLLYDLSAPGVSREIAKAYLEQLPIHTSARWWIETRHLPIKSFLLAAAEPRFQPPHVLPPPASEAAQAVLAGSTLAPDRVKGPTAEVSVATGRVRVLLAEFDEAANKLLKASSFRWDAPAWVCDVPDDTTADRAVEIGVRLLSSGCPVRIFDDALRERMANQDYKPAPTRRVGVSTSDKHPVKFRLSWGLDPNPADCRSRARALHGAKVFDDAAYVSASHFEDIEDFSRRNGFTIMPEAQALIDAQRQRLLGTPRVKAKPKLPESLPPQPERPAATGAIDDDLRDD